MAQELMLVCLPGLEQYVDFEQLAAEIEPVIAPGRSSKSTKKGHPGDPGVLMLKIMILQQRYNLSTLNRGS